VVLALGEIIENDQRGELVLHSRGLGAELGLADVTGETEVDDLEAQGGTTGNSGDPEIGPRLSLVEDDHVGDTKEVGHLQKVLQLVRWPLLVDVKLAKRILTSDFRLASSSSTPIESDHPFIKNTM